MSERALTLAVFAADVWEHVCPVVRVTGPAQAAGMTVLRGTHWENGAMSVDPGIIASADIVLIQRNFPEREADVQAVLSAARAAGLPVVYELDDLLTELPDYHPDYRHFRKARAACLNAALQADAVIASTPFIADYLRPLNPNVHMFPNYLQDQLWPRALAPIRPPTDEVVIGFMGGHSHIPDVEMLAPVLLRLARKYWRTLRLRFWGAPPPPFVRGWANVDALNPYLVSYAEFVPYFAAQHADIFIAPLLDNDFNRGKSHLKFLEYGMLGVPGVYSNLPTYDRIVRHGENGFLAGTEEEWEARLTELIECSDLRRTLGAAARRTVQDDWLLSAHAHHLKEIYENLARNNPRRVPGNLTLVGGKLSRWNGEVEALLVETERERDALATEKADLLGQLDKLQSNEAWVMLAILRKLFDTLFPANRFHGAFVRKLLRSAYRTFLKGSTQGWREFVRNPRLIFAGEWGPQITYPMQDGQPCASPAISILVLTGGTREAADWAAAQTIAPLLDLVSWEAGKACLENGYCWEAPSLPELLAGLRTPYLCVASPDLLSQPQTYLEANLIALETEGLAFTINFRGPVDWVQTPLASGLAPGSRLTPLERMITRKEIVTSGWQINPGVRYPGGPARDAVTGKIILHAADDWDAAGSIPFETKMEGTWCVFGNYLILRPDAQPPFAGAALPLHPPATVMPHLPVADPRPTVLVLVCFLAVGGAERLLHGVLAALADRVRFVIMTVEGTHPSQGTTVEQFRKLTPYVYLTPDFAPTPSNFGMLAYLAGRFNPVSVYIPNGANWIFDHLGQMRRHFPDLRFIIQSYDHRVGWIERYNAEVARLVDIHIAPNQAIRRAYVEQGVHLDQIVLLPHGTDFSEFDPAKYSAADRELIRTRLGLPLDTKVVAFIGRLTPQKRPLDFVELARRFSADPSITFLMVGDGVLREQVIAQARTSRLTNFFRYDFYKPSSDIFAIMDVLVLPSEYEAMPLVVSEALAMGKPVVVNDVGNNREVVELARGGVVLPQIGDIAGLQRGVREMLTNPPDPVQLRAIILENFDIRVIAAKHLPLFLPGGEGR